MSRWEVELILPDAPAWWFATGLLQDPQASPTAEVVEGLTADDARGRSAGDAGIGDLGRAAVVAICERRCEGDDEQTCGGQMV